MNGLNVATAKFPSVRCSGPPSERGEQHDEAPRGIIVQGPDRWRAAIANAHGVDADRYIAGFVSGTDFLPAMRRWTPSLLEEIAGIARGAGQPQP